MASYDGLKADLVAYTGIVSNRHISDKNFINDWLLDMFGGKSDMKLNVCFLSVTYLLVRRGNSNV